MCWLSVEPAWSWFPVSLTQTELTKNEILRHAEDYTNTASAAGRNAIAVCSLALASDSLMIKFD